MPSALLKLDRFETEQNVYWYAVDLLADRTHLAGGGKQQYLTGYIRNLLVLETPFLKV